VRSQLRCKRELPLAFGKSRNIGERRNSVGVVLAAVVAANFAGAVVFEQFLLAVVAAEGPLTSYVLQKNLSNVSE
jgi:hypothetical protein